MDRKQSSQIRSRNATKKNQEIKSEAILDFDDTHVDVYEVAPFAAELAAKQFIDVIVDESAKMLYDHYLQSKVAQHTTDCMFNLIDDIINVEFRKCDKKFNDHSEIKEDHIPKNYYDAHSAYAINIDKKQIKQEVEPEQPQQPISPYRTQKTFYSTRSKLRPLSSTITEETTRAKKKKPEQDLIPIPEPEKTENQQIEQNEEQKMRTIYNLQLKEQQRKKEQQKLRQEEERKVEEFKKKAKKDLDGKSYTYDYNGQPIFFNTKKQNLDSQHIVCPVPYQVKTSKLKDTLDDIVEADTSRLTDNQKEDIDRIKKISKLNNISTHNDKTRRKQSSITQLSNIDSTNRRSSIDSKTKMEESLRKKILNIPVVEAQEVPLKQRTLKQTTQPPQPKINKKDDISDEVYNNGNMRQTTMIPFMTIKDGVKLTEFQNGAEVVKLAEEKVQGEEDEGKKKQMTRNAYFKMIEDSRFQEPPFRQQMNNSRGTITQRTDLLSRDLNSKYHNQEDLKLLEKEEKEIKKHRIASLLIEDQANQSDQDIENDSQKENSVYLGSVMGKPEPIVIKDDKNKRKRITSQLDNAVQYKYNNINPNYFKNYVPNQGAAATATAVESTKNKTSQEFLKKKRSITHDIPTAITAGRVPQNLNQTLNVNVNGQQGDSQQQGVILPLIPAFQKQKQAVLQDMYNQDQKRISSSKQRQRIKNFSVTNGVSFQNGGDYSNSHQNKHNVPSETFAHSKGYKQKQNIPQFLNNQKYLNKSVDMSNGQKKHSSTIVEQNVKERQAALSDKNRNIITFGKNEQLISLLVNL